MRKWDRFCQLLISLRPGHPSPVAIVFPPDYVPRIHNQQSWAGGKNERVRSHASRTESVSHALNEQVISNGTECFFLFFFCFSGGAGVIRGASDTVPSWHLLCLSVSLRGCYLRWEKRCGCDRNLTAPGNVIWLPMRRRALVPRSTRQIPLQFKRTVLLPEWQIVFHCFGR